MSDTTISFRWDFRQQTLTRRTFAEATLRNFGSWRDAKWMLEVYLVRDEMRLVADRRDDRIDPEMRVGTRVRVGNVFEYEDARVRSLAYLAPVEGQHVAYTLIYNVLMENRSAVIRFDDDWLIETIARSADRIATAMRDAP